MGKIRIKSLVSLTIPIFFELLLITIVGNVDTVMLGHYSDEAVGAVGGISQILNIQNSIFGFINLATSILCAQFIGAKNRKRVQEVITVALLLNLILGLVLGAIYAVGWKFILKMIQLPTELISVGKVYFLLVGGLCVFQALTLTCGAVMKSHGNPKQMLYVNIGVNLLNIVGNGMFIFGWLGMPILGPTGVGISTVVSRAIGCVVAFFVMSRYCNFKFRRKFLQPFPFHVIKNILSIGIPTAGENIAWNFGQVIIMSFVNTMGPVMITSRTYLMLLASFVMTFSIALGQGTAIQVGQLVGAHETERAYGKCLKSLYLSIVLAFSVSSMVFLFRHSIMNFFTQNPEIINASVKIFPFMIFLEVGRVFNIVIINSLHAAGDIKFPMFMGIIFIFIVAVPFSYILGISFGMGLVGIWIANALDEWCRGFAMLFRWRSRKWQNKSFI
ncbi:putative FMN/FAD exporter YeeO [Fusobacterium sp. DD29]|uniref:MATE family efflux transporter n=1 Tax=unclassified Fusobacterium TaxID=2648384 RepID=UPI001B8D8DFB|nr:MULTISPECIES: MATE family efflux transporter [unclassified Fusobacterium]MBR8700529.1 putative FMN/FAD exporter YeeO [Fusobacterium sp. DD45]MBR8710278.1 putative FMN/FAD exporter YeeO [Fusobacterium sp. DD28]MBR8749578.1 putative FMN/FAD exporter YeeO [Fusobacterium sp. DD29]MBR8750836.1 putative FMN/FAD exporter YeeO [Fusobacterium sp. DD26]MBR8761834.1 putative FMN/FAD exporter YeeO [Fusobacterium sp. DD25]